MVGGDSVFALYEFECFGDVVEVYGFSADGVDSFDDGADVGVVDDDDVVFFDVSDEPVGFADDDSLSGVEGGFH